MGTFNAQRATWYVGFAASETRSQLSFRELGRRDFRQSSVTVAVTRLRPDGWSWRASLAALTSAEMHDSARSRSVPFGGAAAFTVTRTFYGSAASRLLYTFAGTVTVSSAGAREKDGAGRYLAMDARGAATVGYRALPWLVPYLSGRVFGGPAFWRPTTDAAWDVGTDRWHVQAAAGVSVRTPTGLSVSAEYAPGGERGWSVELGAPL